MPAMPATPTTLSSAEKYLRAERRRVRNEVFPPKARAYAKALAKDPVAARAFLIRAGLITKDGKLAPPYAEPEILAVA